MRLCCYARHRSRKSFLQSRSGVGGASLACCSVIFQQVQRILIGFHRSPRNRKSRRDDPTWPTKFPQGLRHSSAYRRPCCKHPPCCHNLLGDPTRGCQRHNVLEAHATLLSSFLIYILHKIFLNRIQSPKETCQVIGYNSDMSMHRPVTKPEMNSLIFNWLFCEPLGITGWNKPCR